MITICIIFAVAAVGFSLLAFVHPKKARPNRKF